MALNWQHIKGVYSNADNTNPLYTYIEFSNNTALKTVEALPSLYVSNANFSSLTEIEDQATNLGKIITSKAENQTIDKPFTFKDTLSINLSTIKDLLTFKNNNNDILKYIYTNNVIDLKCDRISFKTLNDKQILSLTGNDVTISTDLNTKNIIVNKNSSLKVGDTSEITNQYVKASYFNATSDIRAKENIIPFNQNALNIINKLQTYTYTYKDSQQKSYGIMAQDILDININGFSFVDNVAATGADGDYMSIHESKLVYLLIEGMKEQQKEIQSLKRELEELKNGK